MGSNKFQPFASDQPGWARGLINVVVIGGIAYIGWQWYQAEKKKKDLENANQSGAEADRELQALAAKGIFPNYDNSQYHVFSEALVQAMNGCGTDENVIMNVFRNMGNDADVLMLIKIFGVRFYEPCGWANPIAAAEWRINPEAYGGSLATWLNYDLSASDIGSINNILSQRGIAYRF